ncbi:molybdenum cofactor guanylyltransferase [Paenibacillus paeoniae]|uniref:Molybdenum cofactor guanylyltransferase n=1 Tax=Paenibacillus paeoniae TaxID=2292705 RepID=A0A371PQ50_9BACL|nr:molybdenum cofactor guanylyltransferase [Paenibacillus paeoniae]REK77869.1 molybdenum cofactor guanylyltransferase [Paenibacillus paeoniae]
MSGVILAGGNHPRMNGRNRALLEVDGEAMILRQIREMQTCCSEITIVTNDPQPFLRVVDRDIRIITDYFIGQGLLSGMHAGLALAKHRHVWLLGCHMPFPSASAALLLLSRLQEGMDAVLPWVKGKAIPLHGVYDRSSTEPIEKLLKGGYSSKSALLSEMNWHKGSEWILNEYGIDSGFIQSIQTMEDYERMIRSTMNAH